MPRWTGRIVAIAVVVAIVGAAVFWWIRPKPAPAATAPPPPDVGVIEIKPADVPLPLDYAGRVAGFRDVEIRALVSGMLMKREYEKAPRQAGEIAVPHRSAPLSRRRSTAPTRSSRRRRRRSSRPRRTSTASGGPRGAAGRDAEAPRRRASPPATRRAPRPVAEADIDGQAQSRIHHRQGAGAGPDPLLSPPDGSLIQAQQTLLTTITQLDPAYVNFSFTDAELRELPEIDKSRRSRSIRGRQGRAAVRRRHDLSADRQDHHALAARRSADRHGADPRRVPEPRRRPAARPVRAADDQAASRCRTRS